MYYNFKIIIITALHLTGKVKEAKEYARDMPEEVINKADFCATMGTCYGESGEFEKAFDWLQKGIKNTTKDDEIAGLQVNFAYICTKAGKYEEALTMCNDLLKNKIDLLSTSQKAYCHNNRGYAQMGLGKDKEAMEDITKSLEYYPDNSYAFRNRGLLYLKLGKKDLACADFQTAEKYGFSLSYGDEVKKLLDKHCK